MGTANDAPGITSLSQLAGDLRDVLKALSIEKIDVMGVSFNGGIIQLFALAYPELVGSAAFVATTATGSPLMADRAALAEKNGLESLVEPTRSRGFSQTVRKRESLALALSLREYNEARRGCLCTFSRRRGWNSRDKDLSRVSMLSVLGINGNPPPKAAVPAA